MYTLNKYLKLFEKKKCISYVEYIGILTKLNVDFENIRQNISIKGFWKDNEKQEINTLIYILRCIHDKANKPGCYDSDNRPPQFFNYPDDSINPIIREWEKVLEIYPRNPPLPPPPIAKRK